MRNPKQYPYWRNHQDSYLEESRPQIENFVVTRDGEVEIASFANARLKDTTRMDEKVFLVSAIKYLKGNDKYFATSVIEQRLDRVQRMIEISGREVGVI